jgi:hypothetical protein
MSSCAADVTQRVASSPSTVRFINSRMHKPILIKFNTEEFHEKLSKSYSLHLDRIILTISHRNTHFELISELKFGVFWP